MRAGLGGTQIGKLRLRAAGGNVSALRAQIERTFATVDLEPRSLPKSSILCVRRMQTKVTRGWEQTARQSLEDMAREAVRPFDGNVPARCNSVVFSDLAELLACLAQDFCRGCVGTRWWWRRFVTGPDVLSGILRIWAQEPRYVPAAFEMIANEGFAADFVQRIPDTIAGDILNSVRRVFGLTGSVATEGTSTLIDNRVDEFHDSTSVSCALRAAHIVPETRSPQLSSCQRLLLGSALSIQRVPQLVRTPEFERWVRAWTEGRPAVEVSPDHRADPVKMLSASRSSLFDIKEEDRGECAAVAPVSSQTEPQSIILDSSRLSIRSEKVPALTEPVEVDLAPVVESAEPRAFQSSYAGLFVLINVGLSLGLYPDFTHPSGKGLDLPIWDFVAILASRISDSDLQDDPVWKLLADLSGRNDSTPPGSGFEPPEGWRIPPEWLNAFAGEEGWSWADSHGRLELIHPRGLHIVDVPLPSSDELQTIACWYGVDLKTMVKVPSIQDPAQSSFARWSRHLSDYVQARLGALAPVLCRRAGKIELTAAHLEVTYLHSQLPIDLRLAGLDRDPGWLPSAGRVVRFHYE